MENFAQSTSVIGNLRSILSQYPHGIGTFRELLQNSDDAGATRQIFVLDRRRHPSGNGFDSGPSFLAYNNALVTDSDWRGLQEINSSPKKTDTEKTGKYGLGFRSCFHITDTPEILSGRYLATFDPLERILGTKGVMRDYIGKKALTPHLSSFGAASSSPLSVAKSFEGTIIRLPLRSDAYSDLSPRIVQPDEIRRLLDEFIREEISTVMLFLRHLSTIVIKDVDERGIISVLATGKLDRTGHSSAHGSQTHQVAVEIVTPTEKARSTTWLIVSRTENLAPYAAEMSARLGHDVAMLLSREKLVPDIALAVPVAGDEHSQQSFGRLYTFLPLPITTGFPCHINAHFSLTADRQSLRNAEEHAAEGSSHHVLVEWNKILFSRVLPIAWASLLSVGADRGMDIYSLWPGTYYAEVHGQAIYWNGLPVLLAREVHLRALSVWPQLAGNAVDPTMIVLSAEVLVVNMQEYGSYLEAFTSMGVRLCRIPSHIQRILIAASYSLTLLSPSTARAALLRPHIKSFDSLSSSPQDTAIRKAILDFLLSGRSLADIVDLPLIITDKGYIALRRMQATRSFIFDSTQARLFGKVASSYSQTRDLPTQLLGLLGDTRLWNVARPSVSDIAALVANVVASDIDDPISWSRSFWDWLASLPEANGRKHYAAVSSLQILATSTNKLHAPAAGIYILTREVKRMNLRSLLEDCGLMFLHESIAPKTLNTFNCIQSLRDASSFLKQLSRRPEVLAQAPFEAIQELYVMIESCLPKSRLSEQAENSLRSLPIFPVLTPGLTVARSSRRAIDRGARVYLTKDNILLPDVTGICFLQIPALFR